MYDRVLTADRLIVTAGSNAIPVIFIVVAGSIFLGATYEVFRRGGGWLSDMFIGASAGLTAALVGFVVMYEKSTIEFDLRLRRLQWCRRCTFGAPSGTVPFSSITGVSVQSPLGDEGVASRRIVLVVQGRDLPVSIGFWPDQDDKAVSIADDIRKIVGPVPTYSSL